MTAPPEPSDDLTPSLVDRIRRGDGEAALHLERLYRKPLVRFATGYVGVDEAADVVQEVFVKVLEVDEPPDAFRPWVYRVTRNHCLNRLRGRGRRPDGTPLPSRGDWTAAVTGPLSALFRREREAQLAREIETLTAEQREVLTLRSAEGLSRREVADVLELSESVVKSRLYEALKRLRQRLED